ncbi:MAG: sigma-70 family RNA polymerase sigma factor [Planctomycetes bacterium]|nr:sigma-70 family RNA polymerase sigma factor [Planctomycetota bacterium]
MLLRFLEGGDNAALGSLFERHRNDVERIAHSYSLNASDVEDITQNTFLRALLDASTCRAAPSFVHWITTLARSEGETHRRSTSVREETGGDDLHLARVPSVLERAGSSDQVRILGKAIAALPEPYRSVMHMRFESSRSTAQIASELGRPQETVRKQIYRGVELLRSAIPRGLLAGLLLCVGTRRATAAMTMDAARRLLTRGGRFTSRPSKRWSAATGVLVLALLATLTVRLMRSNTEFANPSLEQRVSERGPTPGTVATERVAESDMARRAGPARTEATTVEPLVVHVRLPDGHLVSNLPLSVFPVTDEPLRVDIERSLDSKTWAQVETDGSGDARVEPWEHGRRAIAVPGLLPRLLVEGSEDRREFTLTVEHDLLVQGVVVDTHDLPIEGARILVSGSGGELDPGSEVTTSAADGTFSARVVCSTATLWAVTPTGDTSFARRVDGPPSPSSSIRLRVPQQDRTLSIRVIDEAGSAIDDATIAWVPESVVHAQRDSLCVPKSAQKLGNGEYRLARVPQQDALVHVFADGFATTSLIASQDAMHLQATLSRGDTVRGVVRDDHGQPVSGIRVIARPAPLAPGFGDCGFRVRSILTDANGAFELASLARATSALFAIGRIGNASYRGRATVALPAAGTVDITVTAVAALTGHLHDPDGNPLAGWTIEATAASGASRGFRKFWRQSVVTSGDGSFAVNLRCGTSQVLGVFRPDSLTWPILVDTCDARCAEDIRLHVPWPKFSTISGRIALKDGSDASTVRARLLRRDWPTECNVTVNAAGRWHLDDVPAGHYHLEFSHASFGHVRSATFEVFGSGHEEAPTIAVESPASLRLEYEARGGEHVLASLFRQNGDFILRRSLSREDGTLLLDNIAPGDYRVFVASSRGVAERHEVTLEQGSLRRIACTLASGTIVRTEILVGGVLNKLKRAGPVELRFRDSKGDVVFEEMRVPDDRSRVRLQIGLTPGDYTIEALCFDGRGAVRAFSLGNEDHLIRLALQ